LKEDEEEEEEAVVVAVVVTAAVVVVVVDVEVVSAVVAQLWRYSWLLRKLS
jgi:hypothetical protein